MDGNHFVVIKNILHIHATKCFLFFVYGVLFILNNFRKMKIIRKSCAILSGLKRHTIKRKIFKKKHCIINIVGTYIQNRYLIFR